MRPRRSTRRAVRAGDSTRAVSAGRVRVFTGSSMPEVLTRIRAELGADAVILQARYVNSRRWLGSKSPAVEITAGAGLSGGGDITTTRSLAVGAVINGGISIQPGGV